MFIAELRWSVRGTTFVTLLFVAAALNALAVYGTVTGLPSHPPHIESLARATTVSIVALGFGGSLFSMIFGALTASRDFGDSAIIRRAYLARGPERLLALRLAALSFPAACFALVSAGAATATAAVVLPIHGYRFIWSGKATEVLLGVAFAVLVMTYIGHLVGWLIRNSIVAVVALVGYTLIAETTIIALVPRIGIFLPGGGTQSITLDKSSTNLILPVGGGYAVLVSWVAALAIANIVRLRRSDLV